MNNKIGYEIIIVVTALIVNAVMCIFASCISGDVEYLMPWMLFTGTISVFGIFWIVLQNLVRVFTKPSLNETKKNDDGPAT